MTRRSGLAAWASGIALGVGMLLWTASAEACPACAARASNGAGFLVLLASMILLPAVISVVVVLVLRRSEHQL